MENTAETVSASPAELDFSAIWAACVASIVPESGLDPELCERTVANLDLVLGANDRRIGGFLDWAQKAQLPPLHTALVARYCLGKGRAQEGLVFANKAFAAHPRDLSIGHLVEECQKRILGDFRTANSEGVFCRKPFEHFEISPGGDVYLCCPGWLPKSIGNVNSEKWNEIWNSTAAQEIRESIHDGTFRHCNTHLCPLIASNALPPTSWFRNTCSVRKHDRLRRSVCQPVLSLSVEEDQRSGIR
jgi:radical SAM protein with 4Fe4S-binding SPASM domain